MAKRKSLLEKYDIPIGHLDFEYIKTCQSGRELEKIVQILRSGEEGYFPDLTKCAETKLKELKPNSRLFRYEEPIKSRNYLDPKELTPIYEWNQDIKLKDTKIAELRTNEELNSAELLPPMRKPGKILIDKTVQDDEKSKPSDTNNDACNNKESRIKSTDYDRWDKYDPDVEILRMDLADERAKEEIQSKNQLNLIKSSSAVETVGDNSEQETERRELEFIKKLSEMEREKYAEEYRICGNEYFRAKEYEDAIREYTRAIKYDPKNAARAYNNRAISYFKLKIYLSAIEDCEECLKLEPKNIKAWLRLADANYAQGRRLESLEQYQKVLELEPQNAAAQKAIGTLRAQLGELPPANATRLKIEDCNSIGNIQKTTPMADKTSSNKKANPSAQQPIKKPAAKEYDLAELVKPNNVVKSKLTTAAEALGNITAAAKAHRQNKQQAQMPSHKPKLLPPAVSPEPEILLSANAPHAGNKGKLLIEEI